MEFHLSVSSSQRVVDVSSRPVTGGSLQPENPLSPGVSDTSTVSPAQGGLPSPGRVPSDRLPLSSWQPKDLAGFSYEDVQNVKLLPSYGSAVTAIMKQSLAPASRNQYASHWRSFTDWIIKTDQSVKSPALILRYLEHLFSARELSVLTLKNHLSAFKGPFRDLTGLTLDPLDERAFLRACFRIRPPPRQLVPQ